MHRQHRLGGMVLVLIFSAALSASAADPASRPAGADFTLDQTVVTPSRTPQKLIKTPYTVDVVGEKTIEEKSFRTVPEALQEVPGVLIQKTSNGQGSPYIRGFTGFRTLFLIDGIRLNNSTFRDGPNQYWATIDPLTIQRMEVVKGPGSVLYGSDAVGGTVSAFTKSPWTYEKDFQLGANLFLRTSCAERSFAIHPELSLSSGNTFGALAMGSSKNYGDVIGGRDIGEQPNTGYSEWSGDLKLEYFFNPDTKLVLAHQHVRENNAARTHSTRFAKSFEGSTVGSDFRRDFDQERRLTYLQLHANNIQGSFIDSMVANLSFHTQYENEDRIRGSGSHSTDDVNVGTLGLWTQMVSKTKIGELTYGFEWYRDNVSSSSSTNPIQGPVADDAAYDLVGVYLQDRIAITPRLELTLGGRYTYARADANKVADPNTDTATSIEEDWSALVGSVRLAYQIVPERVSVFGGVSTGFRAPNLSDLTRLDSARSGELEVPTVGLDPEYYTSYEIGVKGGYPDFSFQAAYFYTTISDSIIRVPTAQTSADGEMIVNKLNDGDGWVHGVELGASWRFQRDFTLFGTVAWMDGELDGYPTSDPVKVRESLSRMLPTTYLLGLRYEPNKNIFIESTVLLADDQDRLASNDVRDTQRIPPGGTPGYTNWSIRAGWRINRHAQFTAGIENILDEDYRVHGSGTNSPGRNFMLGLTLSY